MSEKYGHLNVERGGGQLYLSGRHAVAALWLNSKGGLDGRINGIFVVNSEYIIGDLTCAFKFGSKRDSLRGGWKFSPNTLKLFHAEVDKLRKSGKVDAQELRALDKAAKTNDFVQHLSLARGKKAWAWRRWIKPHKFYGNVGFETSFIQPIKQAPESIRTYAQAVGAVSFDKSKLKELLG